MKFYLPLSVPDQSISFICTLHCRAPDTVRIFSAAHYKYVVWGVRALGSHIFILLPMALIGMHGVAQDSAVDDDDKLLADPTSSVFSNMSHDAMKSGAFPFLVMCLLLTAALAAVMSTTDSLLSSLGNICANDVSIGRHVTCIHMYVRRPAYVTLQSFRNPNLNSFHYHRCCAWSTRAHRQSFQLSLCRSLLWE